MKRHWNRIVIIGVFTSLLIIFIVNLIIDPYQIFHQHQKGFLNNERMQNAGLINSYLDADNGYDAVIIGTSMTENFYASEVSEKMGWGKVLKLSASGASLFTQKTILLKALQTGRVKHVLWSLNARMFLEPVDKLQKSDNGFDSLLYLYDNSRVNDIKYLLNGTTSMASFKMLTGMLNLPTQDLDLLYNNHIISRYVYNKNQSVKSLKNLEKVYERRMRPPLKTQITKNMKFIALEENFLNIVKEHPAVEFIVFSPPYSKVSLSHRYEQKNAFLYQVVEHIQVLPNIKIFAFDDCEFNGNVYFYKDKVHYTETINSFMINEISKGNGQVSKDNIDRYYSNTIEGFENYKVYSEKAVPSCVNRAERIRLD
ncbi:MAG: hypothetical protein GQ474_04330 [Sulfurimonas sp.]|nr:hypothetical protein [Sulfurimonas sp.]